MKKVFLFSLLFTVVACTNYSSGNRTGYLVKFSRKGKIYKTWEGTLNLGGFKTVTDHDGSSVVANTWNFSLDEKHHRKENIQSLSDSLNLALDEGYRVKLHYNQEKFTNCFGQRGDELYFIDQVEIIRH